MLKEETKTITEEEIIEIIETMDDVAKEMEE